MTSGKFRFYLSFCTPKNCIFWLFILNVALLSMVFLGGVTRLTGSGLSIVTWDPITGVLPPLSQASWEALFAQYKGSPEFKQVNWFFTLADFQRIFWLEYWHRLLGRLLGVFLLIPTVWLWRTPSQRWRLLLLWILGGVQGGMGWWMVKSGLVHNPWVSPFRLTAHLLLALLIFSIAWRLFLDHLPVPPQPALSSRRLRRALRVCLVFLCITIIWGGMVAGTKAGLFYNTFPLMDGQWIPEGFLFLSPFWRNFIENPACIQWTHRVLALLTISSFFYLSARYPKVWFLGVAAFMQGTLGALTIVGHVPLWTAALHQLMAFILLGLCLWAWRKYA